MFKFIARSLASLSLALGQPLPAYCELDTVDGDALVSNRRSYVSFVRLRGLNKIALRPDIERIAEELRIELSGLFERPGHAVQAWYACDPDLSGLQIDQHLASSHTVARQIGLNLADILAERSRVWPRMMRWEDCFFVLWSKKALLTREEGWQSTRERDDLKSQLPDLGDAQKPFLKSRILAGKHHAFVQRFISAFRNHGVMLEVVSSAQAVQASRASTDPMTITDEWEPLLPSSKCMPCLPEDDNDAEALLVPSIAYQIFSHDANTKGGTLKLGSHEWLSTDMEIGPEDPRPFVELMSKLAQDHIPWRVSMLVESGGRNLMMFKQLIATLLGKVPSNRQIFETFGTLRSLQDENRDTIVKFRCSFATWSELGDTDKLRRRLASISQRVQGWGNCRTNSISGHPLEGVISSALGLSATSTAPPGAARLSEVLRMLPWSHQASPWDTGSVIFRTPEGRIWPFDPAGSKRTAGCDIFVAPMGFGKSVLANTINLGLCLSSASQIGSGAKLPLIGKLDVGPSAAGLISLLEEALPPERRNEAIYVPFKFIHEHAFNVFDTQIGCRYPLQLERDFLLNFLSLACMPIDEDTPFEGMDQLVSFVIDEIYSACADSSERYNKRAKRYLRGVEPKIDTTLAKLGTKLEDEVSWWEIVDILCDAQMYYLAGIAQRHAVPVMEDLITAVRTTRVKDTFAKVKAETGECLTDLFTRYIMSFIRKYPTLSTPTCIDFGPARVIVLDLQNVAPTGSAESDRQTEQMYLLGRHILARNFFLHPDYIQDVPERVQAYHAPRFLEIKETLKRLDLDEYQRTKRCRYTREQVVRDVREGRKHNTQVGVTSQISGDYDDELISLSTARFILGAGDEKEAKNIAKLFSLSNAAAAVVEYKLKGPDPKGGGAPFLAIIEADGIRHEQMIVNSLGPVELWALSTTPVDVALRTRLYDRLGPIEARRRLARVFFTGSAKTEIERRKTKRMRGGDDESQAVHGVVDELAHELIDGTGLGIVLRQTESDTALA